MQEREKIRDLKKRRINGGGSVFGGLGLRKPTDGVYIRMDQADESAEVDIWGSLSGSNANAMGAGNELRRSFPGTWGKQSDADPGDVDIPSHGGKALVGKSWPVPEPSPKVGRQRRLTRKVFAVASSSTSRSSRARSKQVELAEPDETEDRENGNEPDTHTQPTKEVLLDKKGKPRPETYKQAWSISEQHLLERLLEEIPDGEKNRYGFLSHAPLFFYGSHPKSCLFLFVCNLTKIGGRRFRKQWMEDGQPDRWRVGYRSIMKS